MKPLNSKQIQDLVKLVKSLGRELLVMWEDETKVTFKEDNTYITEPDLFSDKRLKDSLIKIAPYPICSEENGSDIIEEDCWLIDPIDGTGAYVAGIPTWAISVALIIKGLPVFGLMHFPAFARTLHSYSDGISLIRNLHSTGENFITVSSNAHSHYQINYKGKSRSLGSCCAAIYYVAIGKADFALLSKPKYWDYASGIPILKKGGGGIYYLSGEPLDYKHLLLKPKHLFEPIVAVHDQLKDRVKDIIKYSPPQNNESR